MADNIKVGTIIYDVVVENADANTATIQDLEKNLKSVGDSGTKSINGLSSSMSRFQSSLGPVGGKITSFLTNPITAAVGAFGLLAVGIKKSIDAYKEQESEQFRLSQILATNGKATREQTEALFQQAEALEKIGVVSGGNVNVVQAQLATFDLTYESISKLTPAILDYVVAEKGATASSDEFKNMTNGLAQALNGNYASLSRTGFVLSDTTKEIIANGTEAEKTAEIVDVLNSTYEGFNEELRKTSEGRLQAMRNGLRNLATQIGSAFMPAIEAITDSFIDMSGALDENGNMIEVNSDTIEFLKRSLYNFAQFIAIFIRTAIAPFKAAWIALSTPIKALGTLIGAISTGKWENIKEASKDIKDTFKDAGADFGDLLENTFGKNLTNLKNLVDDTDYLQKKQIINDRANKNALEKQKASYVDKDGELDKELVKKQKEALKEAQKDLENYQKAVLKAQQDITESKEKLAEDIAKGFEDFNKSASEQVQTTADGLADIVIRAEEQIKKLKEDLANAKDVDQTVDINKQIADQQKILDASIGYNQRQVEFIKSLKKQIEEAGIDSSKVNFGSETAYEDALEQKRKEALMDEFTLFETQQNKKLQMLVDAFIQETTLMQQKADMLQKLEQETTDFMKSENFKRTKDIQAFVSNAMAQYGSLADSLKSVISLQQQAGMIGNTGNVETKALGGYAVQGDVVGQGEYVIPRNMVANMPELVAGLENMRTGQTNNITINGADTGKENFDLLLEQMLWKMKGK